LRIIIVSSDSETRFVLSRKRPTLHSYTYKKSALSIDTKSAFEVVSLSTNLATLSYSELN